MSLNFAGQWSHLTLFTELKETFDFSETRRTYQTAGVIFANGVSTLPNGCKAVHEI